jgi:hypothetical protein
VLATILIMTVISILILPSILWLYALVDVVINEFFNFGTKLAWLVFLLLLPPITTILYFIIGRNQRITAYSAGKTVIIIIILIPLIMIISIYVINFSGSGVQSIPQNSVTI